MRAASSFTAWLKPSPLLYAVMHGRGGPGRKKKASSSRRRSRETLNPFAQNAGAEMQRRHEQQEAEAAEAEAKAKHDAEFRKTSGAADFRKDSPEGDDEPLATFIARVREQVAQEVGPRVDRVAHRVLEEMDLRRHIGKAIRSGYSTCTVALPGWLVQAPARLPDVDVNKKELIGRVVELLSDQGVQATAEHQPEDAPKVCCTNPLGPNANGECTLCGQPYRPPPPGAALRLVLTF